MADLLVDTDVFVDHLRGAVALVPGRHRLHYSVVTRAELFAGNTARNLSSQLLAPFRFAGDPDRGGAIGTSDGSHPIAVTSVKHALKPGRRPRP